MNSSPRSSQSGERTGQTLYQRARQRIPGGAQLLGKRPEQYLPDNWPAYFSRASGYTVFDLDDRPYRDFTSCGIGTCLLGYADPVVNAAVVDRVQRGSMCTLNSPDEVELADVLCAMHPWAEKVRYARTGGEAMMIATRIARAATGRDKVAFCGYHGWGDWYLAANLGESTALDGHLLPGLAPAGVARALRGTALPFRYNRIAELEAIVAVHRGDLAAIVMEPMRHDAPQDGFLQRVRALADEAGAVLVFDEITSGLRSHHGGIHLKLGVAPDIAVLAKSISNGYPMAAIFGRGRVMDAVQSTFVSSTYWTEGVGPAAAVATLERLRAVNAVQHIDMIGTRVLAGWREASARAGVPITVSGIPALCLFRFNLEGESQAAITLFAQEMLDRGFLANGGFYPTYAHDEAGVAAYLEAVAAVFGVIRDCHRGRGIRAALRGPIAHSGFTRLT